MASYVSPAIRDKFETLSVDLKNMILARNVQLNTMYDLINVLEQIVAESGEKTLFQKQLGKSCCFFLSRLHTSDYVGLNPSD